MDLGKDHQWLLTHVIKERKADMMCLLLEAQATTHEGASTIIKLESAQDSRFYY